MSNSADYNNPDPQSVRTIANIPLNQDTIERIERITSGISTVDVSIVEITDKHIRDIRDKLNRVQNNAVASTADILFMVQVFAAISRQGITAREMLGMVVRIYPLHADEILADLELFLKD